MSGGRTGFLENAINPCSLDPLLASQNHSVLLNGHIDLKYDTEHTYRLENIWQDGHLLSRHCTFCN